MASKKQIAIQVPFSGVLVTLVPAVVEMGRERRKKEEGKGKEKGEEKRKEKGEEKRRRRANEGGGGKEILINGLGMMSRVT